MTKRFSSASLQAAEGLWRVFGYNSAAHCCSASGDVLQKRLKFVVRPVKAGKKHACLRGGCDAARSCQVPLPVPAKSPKDAEFVGPYFGDGARVDACLNTLAQSPLSAKVAPQMLIRP